MQKLLFSFIAISGGVFLAIQAGFNSRLGMLLKNPLLAAICTSVTSVIVAVLLVILTAKQSPAMTVVRSIPFYLWFIGGVFSVAGISLYFYTIPKLGLSTMVSLGLCGQVLFTLIAGHFGWLNLPVETVTLQRLIGALCLMAGVLLINLK